MDRDEIKRRQFRRQVDIQKQVVDEVMKEWLDEKYEAFGKWSFRALLAIAFFVIVHGILTIKIQDIVALMDAREQLKQLAN